MKNHIGEKYGRLLVIEDVPREQWKSKRREVLCLCDCGNIKRYRLGNLVSGNTESCGCLESELTKQRCHKPIVGKRFGRLLVLSEDDLNGDSNKRKATCLCDCGKITRKRIGDLRYGMTRSCGCLKTEVTKKLYTEDLTGQTFGELTALRQVENFVGSTGISRVQWLWKCSCGREFVALALNVKRGYTKSCGHLGKSKAEYEIFKYLSDNNIEFSYNVCPFDDFRNPLTGYKLYVDFCFIKPNGEHIFVEHQGEQHFYTDEKNNNFGYAQRKLTDEVKKKYCKDKGIKLYETRYDEDYIKHMEFILKENGLLNFKEE